MDIEFLRAIRLEEMRRALLLMQPGQRILEIGAGWRIESVQSNGLFYTGNFLLSSRLPIGIRRILWRVLGSACLIYVTRTS